VDYQTMALCNPTSDLLYFIFTGSDGEFRRRHYKQLLDHYHHQLNLALTRLHLNPDKIFSRQDFDDELKEVRICLYLLLLLTLFPH
jgi:hypothetical protein